MHLAFVDIVYDYTASRPDEDAPLGGTTTAICFMARELAKAGISCTFFNKIATPQTAHGIEALPLEALIKEAANPKYTAFIFCGRWVEWMVKSIFEVTKAPLIAWMHESQMDQPFTPALDFFNGVVFVSDWQKRINQICVRPHWRQAVIRNAMNPCFAGLFGSGESILAAKTQPPTLLYAGTTPRGVIHLPVVLDFLRRRRQDFSMEIYCECTPSRDAKINADYIERMRSLANVTHVGMIGQRELAQRMKRANFLLAPNPWPETSCITLMEALAAGTEVITTNRAALPETADGFARHIAIEDADHPSRFDMPIPSAIFAEAIDKAINRRLKTPEETDRALRKQADHFIARYQWSQRAMPWIDFLRSFG